MNVLKLKYVYMATGYATVVFGKTSKRCVRVVR